MAQRTASPADLTRSAINLARAITIALRSWGFYPPEHPAVVLAVDRLVAAAADAANSGLMQLAVTPHQLLLDGVALDSTELAVVECAELLHDRDILQVSIMVAPAEPVVRALLAVLSLDRDTRRARGGPAALWAAEDQNAILVEQIDYQEILERELDEGPARRDATWKAIVRSIIMGRSTFSAEEQQRLLDISRDVGAIGELAKDSKEPFTTPDGSPLVTTQAATVLAVYRHIAKTVAALEPERVQEVIQSLALAASNLDPSTALELMLQEESAGENVQIVGALKQAFDDQQVAMLLARACSAPGHPTNRLAKVLDTLAPDADRKRRVLTLAKRLISERDFGSKRPIDDIRQSLDELLLKYDESSYVSAEYRESMDQAAARAVDLSARGLPPELGAWLETLGHDSVRRLSGQLLIDLLRNESQAERMAETARDMAAFVEELLLAGAFADAVPVVGELLAATTRKAGLAPEACRRALDGLGAAAALAEATTGLADQSKDELASFESVVRDIGAAAVPALLSAYQQEAGGVATERASALLVKLGPSAIPGLAAAVDDKRWFVQHEVAQVLGQIGTPAAVPPLQVLLRRTDLRVMHEAVSAMARIDDPAAARAMHMALKATSGEARAAVIAALVGLKDPRVVPMLGRILGDSDPFGEDFSIVLDTLGALASFRDDRALAQIAATAKRRRWLAWGKTTQLREASLRALARIGTAKARQTVDDLARTGDFFLRRMAASAATRPPL
ncbi:MAG: HEAT repeat domain-containing protein [Vicinamibacterales bacterium]|jgi:HEAT repeat protein